MTTGRDLADALAAERGRVLNRFLSLAGQLEGAWDESDGDPEVAGWVDGQREAGRALRELVGELSDGT